VTHPFASSFWLWLLLPVDDGLFIATFYPGQGCNEAAWV